MSVPGHGVHARDAAPGIAADGTSCISNCTIRSTRRRSTSTGAPVPLESDLTTPLAYALNQKELQNLDSSTVGPAESGQDRKAARACTCSSRISPARFRC